MLDVVIEGDFYDWTPSHLNAQALADLDAVAEKFCEGNATETEMREAIKRLRDLSQVAYIDLHMRASEPSIKDAEMLQRLFDAKEDEYLNPTYTDNEGRDVYLLEKTARCLDLYLEQFKYDRSGHVTLGHHLLKTHRQFKILWRRCLGRPGYQMSEAVKRLSTEYKERDFNEPNNDKGPVEMLAEYKIDDIELSRDYYPPEPEIVVALDQTAGPQRLSMTLEDVPFDAEIAPTARFEELQKIIPPSGGSLFDNVEQIKEEMIETAVAVIALTNEPARVESSTSTLENPVEALQPSPTIESEPVDLEMDTEYQALSQKVYCGLRIERAQEQEIVLSDDEKALAGALAEDDDGSEPDEDQEEVQDTLFSDMALGVKKEKIKMFTAEQKIDAAFEYHRRMGFPYRDVSPAMAMRELEALANVDGKALISTRLCYQVADTFHRHRLAASANGMKSPLDSYHDDKKLRKAITLELKLGGKPRIFAGGMMTLVNGTQACSNFRPGFAAYLYREHCPDDAVVLDTSTGYGGRMLGAVASRKVKKYIGIDPNVPTYKANIEMIEKLDLRSIMEFTLYNLPAEDVDVNLVRDLCDFSFTSPPYFAKEIYSQDDTQSWKRYSTGNAWRDGFLKKMLYLTFVALKTGSTAIVNIADVTVKGKKYPLAQWTIECGQEVGFTYVETQSFPMMTRFGANMAEGVATEPVIVFKKP
jgi:hypothetical protein